MPAHAETIHEAIDSSLSARGLLTDDPRDSRPVLGTRTVAGAVIRRQYAWLSRRLGGKSLKITWQQLDEWCDYPHIRKGIEQAVISTLGTDIKPVQMVLISVASSQLGLSDESDKSGPHKSASDGNDHIILRLALRMQHINTQRKLKAQN